MTRFVVSDLTRFTHDKDHVCIAGLSLDSGECIRPLPYLSYQQYKQMGICPGVTLSAEFWPKHPPLHPHVEDWNYKQVSVVSGFDQNSLHDVLDTTSVDTVSDGFGTHVAQKFIPIDSNPVPTRSIITLAVEPRSFSLNIDRYDKIRASFSDRANLTCHGVPVADLGISNYVMASGRRNEAAARLTAHLRAQQSLFLRVGIGRPWKTDDGRDGYWLQINGAFSFPNLHGGMECY